jgi:hypothetical protein
MQFEGKFIRDILTPLSRIVCKRKISTSEKTTIARSATRSTFSSLENLMDYLWAQLVSLPCDGNTLQSTA